MGFRIYGGYSVGFNQTSNWFLSVQTTFELKNIKMYSILLFVKVALVIYELLLSFGPIDVQMVHG